ncbi:iron chelate uptake ABC transporter family permease subunit [Roseobacter sp. HKCCA0434]|uniref:iron chelate uptake ABC transporter family permease subunit n=1 Tax=Roseobacter sp. HKCCA0434 TaxID=3079297 RepID=UPI0029057E3F|nr:iron chelate uptake ABC transporter family permease subunit [Roseobacter sp. HKCCA0434]
MFDDFLIRATLAAVGVAIAAALLGCFVVWRRMAYFGDATAHAAILGVALSLALSISVFAGALAVAVVMATIVAGVAGRSYGEDTLLGVLSHASLALGLVAVSLLPGVRVDLSAYLFGDILAVGKRDLAIIWVGVVLVAALIFARWSRLLTATLDRDLAHASGIDPRREQLVLMLALAVVVAVAIKVVGALLITALLIIPAAAARPFGRTPEGMATGAVLLGVVSAIGGMGAAYRFDTPTGPTIVTVAAGLFVLSNLARLRSGAGA